MLNGKESDGSGIELLLEAAARGEKSAQEQVALYCVPIVRAEVRRRMPAALFAYYGEDVQQMAHLAIVKGLPMLRIRNRRGLNAWVRIVTKRQILDWRKARKAKGRIPSRDVIRLGSKAPELPGSGPTPSWILLGKEDRKILAEAIESVDPRYRRVLRFILKHSPTSEELAAKFPGKTKEAIRKFLDRAIGHLQEAVARRYGLPPGAVDLRKPPRTDTDSRKVG